MTHWTTTGILFKGVLCSLFMPLLYFDTNVIIYASEESFNLFGKEISSSSGKLVFQTILCNHQVIISDWALKELELKNKLSQASMLLMLLEKKTVSIQKTDEDEQLAKEQCPNNIQDYLHCLLAKRAGAEYIVTRNTDDFMHFNNVIPIVKPEQLL